MDKLKPLLSVAGCACHMLLYEEMYDELISALHKNRKAKKKTYTHEQLCYVHHTSTELNQV